MQRSILFGDGAVRSVLADFFGDKNGARDRLSAIYTDQDVLQFYDRVFFLLLFCCMKMVQTAAWLRVKYLFMTLHLCAGSTYQVHDPYAMSHQTWDLGRELMLRVGAKDAQDDVMKSMRKKLKCMKTARRFAQACYRYGI